MKHAFLISLLFFSSCLGEEDVINDLNSERESYLQDRTFRRHELEASLWKPALPYAQTRLNAYALDDAGWDLLPTMSTFTGKLSRPTQQEQKKKNLLKSIPSNDKEWIELGKRVFWTMPMRRDPYLEWLVQRPEHWEEVGLQSDDEGNLIGVARFTDARGEERAGATCGFCHGESGEAGPANRQLNLGLGRDLFNAGHGVTSHYADWGFGKVDVTDDGVQDALKIPDLFRLADAKYINSSASVKVNSTTSLAIRFETQYITGHAMEARPRRELVWALARFVQTLKPLRKEMPKNDLFEQKCASCHPISSGFGGLISADQLTSDNRSAHSQKRGTGFYKAPFLTDVSERAPYLHDASVDTLDTLLKEGHVVGDPLTASEQHELLLFLEQL